MLNPIRTFVAFFCVLTVAACSLPRGAAIQSEVLDAQDAENAPFAIVPVTQNNLAALETWPATGWRGGYHWLDVSRGPASNVIRTGDRVDLVIWDSQDNSLLTAIEQKNVNVDGLEVSPSGTIFVPYVEDIVVRGMTPVEARKKIQQSLEMIVPSAQVQLSVEAGQKNSVDAVRGVAQPGNYPLPGRDYSILSLISAAGGVSSELRNPVARLIRGNNTYEIPVENLFEDASKNIILRGGDKVLIEEDDRYFISLGASRREELVYFDKEQITALEAVSMVGGLSDYTANPEGVLILREYEPSQIRTDGGGPNREQVVFTVDLTTADGLFAARNFQINPKDTVLATESPVNGVRTVFGILGSLVGITNQVQN